MMRQDAPPPDAFSVVPDHCALSPNQGPRRDGRRPSLVILHYTGMARFEDALARLRDPEAGVSAHYLIRADGAIWGLAPEDRRAWHAGVSRWRGETDVNSASIGVELDHPGPPADPRDTPPFPEPQMAALERLLAAATRRWGIEPDGVLGHSDVAPGRKIDPGERFDWGRLARLGLARAAPARSAAATSPPRGGDAAQRFAQAVQAIGYGPWPAADLLDAFRRRWRPGAALAGGGPSAADAALAEALATSERRGHGP